MGFLIHRLWVVNGSNSHAKKFFVCEVWCSGFCMTIPPGAVAKWKLRVEFCAAKLSLA